MSVKSNSKFLDSISLQILSYILKCKWKSIAYCGLRSIMNNCTKLQAIYRQIKTMCEFLPNSLRMVYTTPPIVTLSLKF
jgi:hypothetical protein